MASFSEVETTLPPGNVVVPRDAFASTWIDRPEDEEVCIGLRLIPNTDIEDARIEAARHAAKLFPNHEKSEETTALFVASFNDAMIRWVIARGTCDPNNVHAPWKLWEAAPEDIVKEALTDLGAQLIFDAWERMRLALDIGIAVASDEDIALLADLAKRLPKLRTLSRAREQRCRRLLRFVLEELETVPDETPDAVDPPEDDDIDDESDRSDDDEP